MSENRHRGLHYHARSDYDERVKADFGWLAKKARMPKGIQVPVLVIGVPLTRPGVALSDAGNCYPTVKAAVDGLVAVGALIDDSPKHVHAITLLAAQRAERDGLVLLVEEIPEGGGSWNRASKR